jgi:hypothetical protein
LLEEYFPPGAQANQMLAHTPAAGFSFTKYLQNNSLPPVTFCVLTILSG